MTHDLNLARLCDRMVRRSGQIEAGAASAVARTSCTAPSRHAAEALPFRPPAAPAAPRLPRAARGLKGFGIFLACIALGVAAIAGISSLSRSLTEGISREGRRILGGDMAFS